IIERVQPFRPDIDLARALRVEQEGPRQGDRRFADLAGWGDVDLADLRDRERLLYGMDQQQLPEWQVEPVASIQGGRPQVREVRRRRLLRPRPDRHPLEVVALEVGGDADPRRLPLWQLDGEHPERG